MTIKRRNSNSKRTWDDFINDSVNDFIPLEKSVLSLHIGEKVWEKSFFFFFLKSLFFLEKFFSNLATGLDITR